LAALGGPANRHLFSEFGELWSGIRPGWSGPNSHGVYAGCGIRAGWSGPDDPGWMIRAGSRIDTVRRHVSVIHWCTCFFIVW